MTWDGEERRSLPPEKILEIARGGSRPEWDTRRIVIGVLAAGILIFQGAALLGHRTLSDRQEDERIRSEAFRRTVSCFLVEITEPEKSTDRVEILTRCGLLGTATDIGEEP